MKHLNKWTVTIVSAIAVVVLMILATTFFTGPVRPKLSYLGVVTDDENRPINDAQVTLELRGGKSLVQSTNSAGKFSFDPVDYHAIGIEVSKVGFSFLKYFEYLDSDTPLRFVGVPSDSLADIEVGGEHKVLVASPDGEVIELVGGIRLEIKFLELSERQWSVRLEVLDGEVRRSPADYVINAPTEGYSSQLVIDSSTRNKGKYELVLFKYDAQGQDLYGWFKIMIKPRRYEGPTVFILASAVNTEGRSAIFHPSQGNIFSR